MEAQTLTLSSRESVALLIFRAKSSTFKRICHPACPGVPWKHSGEPALSEVEGDLLFLSVHPI
jgi:hypothetical protein